MFFQGFFRKGEVEYKAGQYAMALMSYKVRGMECSADSRDNEDKVNLKKRANAQMTHS